MVDDGNVVVGGRVRMVDGWIFGDATRDEDRRRDVNIDRPRGPTASLLV